jgi:predicted nuclease with TOPRIM domain
MNKTEKILGSKGIIQEYEELRFFYNETQKEIERLKAEQQQLLIKTIKKLQPELEWLRKHNYYFIHPAFGDLKSTKGPILGLTKEKQFVYIYDIQEQSLIKCDTHDEFKTYNISALDIINSDLFMDAMEGVLYTRELLNEYNNRISTIHSNLKADLDNYTRVFNDL